ncbi:helix-turn-helix transcriptional regulator [Alteromonas stellipolaris]|uniref:helix-turn-helix transcriptional regulator n=1 Tax=Alteromonas stellipolaris TaxID=233316 RepID=UPI0027369C5D|nr:DNA-binding protein [Alteromonas stellipolaris]MDP2596625.1 DNA-binding protein [Alteromonas stellipolaris]
MNLPIQPRLLSEKEASLYICMSRSFLRQARMDGNRENRTPAPPFIKIGRAVRYLREDLDAWLESFVRRTHLYQDESAA